MSKIVSNAQDLEAIQSTNGDLTLNSSTINGNLSVNGGDLTLNRSGWDNSIVLGTTANSENRNVIFQKAGGGNINGQFIFKGKVNLANQPRFMAAGNSGNTSYASSGSPFIMNISKYDSTGSYNTSNGIFTAPVSGYYRFSFSSYTYASGQWAVMLWNGSALEYYNPGPADHCVLCTVNANSLHHMSWVMYLAANQGAAVAWRAGFSGNLYLSHGQFSGEMISAA